MSENQNRNIIIGIGAALLAGVVAYYVTRPNDEPVKVKKVDPKLAQTTTKMEKSKKAHEEKKAKIGHEKTYMPGQEPEENAPVPKKVEAPAPVSEVTIGEEEWPTINKGFNGNVSFDDFLKIFDLIKKRAFPVSEGIKKKYNDQRRSTFASGNEQQYKAVVIQQMQEAEMVMQTVCLDITKKLNITQNEFMAMQQLHQVNPKFEEYLIASESQTKQEGWEPKLEKETCIDALTFLEETKIESLDRQIKNQQLDPLTQILEEAKIEDALFARFGIDQVEYLLHFQHFNLQDNPIVQKVQQESQEKLQYLQMQMMGSGMMGPPQY